METINSFFVLLAFGTFSFGKSGKNVLRHVVLEVFLLGGLFYFVGQFISLFVFLGVFLEVSKVPRQIGQAKQPLIHLLHALMQRWQARMSGEAKNEQTIGSAQVASVSRICRNQKHRSI